MRHLENYCAYKTCNYDKKDGTLYRVLLVDGAVNWLDALPDRATAKDTTLSTLVKKWAPNY